MSRIKILTTLVITAITLFLISGCVAAENPVDIDYEPYYLIEENCDEFLISGYDEVDYEMIKDEKAAELWREAYDSLLRRYIGQAQSFLLHDINGTGIPEVFVFESGKNSFDRVALYTFFEEVPVLVAESFGGMGTGWGWSLLQSGEGVIENGGYSALWTVSHLILVGTELVTVQQGFVPLDPMSDYEALGYFLAPVWDYYLGTGVLPEIPSVTREEFNSAFPEKLEEWESKYLQLTEVNIQSELAVEMCDEQYKH